MTNMCHFHTLSTSIVNLIPPLIIFMNLKLVELSCDMIGSPCVNVPVCIYPIGTFGIVVCVILIIIITVAPPTFISGVSFLLADLTENTVLEGSGNTVGVLSMPSFWAPPLVLASALLWLRVLWRTRRTVWWWRRVWQQRGLILRVHWAVLLLGYVC